MKENHSHQEAALRRATKIPVRAADPLTKAQREILEREKRDTNLADDWIRDNGGWTETLVVDENGDAVHVTGVSTESTTWTRNADAGSEED